MVRKLKYVLFKRSLILLTRQIYNYSSVVLNDKNTGKHTINWDTIMRTNIAYLFALQHMAGSRRPLKSDDHFSYRLVTTPSSPPSNVVLPAFFINSAMKNNLIRVSRPWMVLLAAVCPTPTLSDVNDNHSILQCSSKTLRQCDFLHAIVVVKTSRTKSER